MLPPPRPNPQKKDSNHRQAAQPHGAFLPVYLGQLEHHEIERAFPLLGERRGLGKFFRQAEFDGQRLDDLRHVQLQQRGVGARKTSDVNRGNEYVKVSLFEGANVVAADLGDLRDLGNLEFAGFARRAELFCNRWHVRHV